MNESLVGYLVAFFIATSRSTTQAVSLDLAL